MMSLVEITFLVIELLATKRVPSVVAKPRMTRQPEAVEDPSGKTQNANLRKFAQFCQTVITPDNLRKTDKLVII
jgi:hypothetical protein